MVLLPFDCHRTRTIPTGLRTYWLANDTELANNYENKPNPRIKWKEFQISFSFHILREQNFICKYLRRISIMKSGYQEMYLHPKMYCLYLLTTQDASRKMWKEYEI